MIANSSPVSTLIGVDTGGTFTDLVLVAPDGTLMVLKLPSSPDDPSRSVVAGVSECLSDGLIPDSYEVVHGTTVATNALLQRRGVRTAFITTRGFRDMLAIGRQTRTKLYTFHPEKPIPLLERRDCHELTERLDWQGNLLTPLEEAEIVELLDFLVTQGVESVAVCFLFAYLNPVHERIVGRLARDRGLAVSLSSDIAPEPREYERASTTVANAFVSPLMATYLRSLHRQLEILRARRLYVMQSNGGVLSAEEASHRAVATALSGPAGGVVASIAVGKSTGYPNLITFDMGGTSTDVALIVDGSCPVVTISTLGDLPLRTPQLSIHTVGAGGGSLARLDIGGGLRVGPQSAGADPGPVAYGRGDTLTVTDANVLLGRLPADLRLAGRVPLDVERVRARFASFATELKRGPEEAALGILTVANATMARALRHVSVEKGYDPAGFALLAFGGAGGLHACALAEALDMSTVLIPRCPGAFSALGLIMADVRREYVQAMPPTRLPASDGDASPREQIFHQIVKLAEQRRNDPVFAHRSQRGTSENALNGEVERVKMLPEGIEEITDLWYLDLRYVGQSFDLRVPVVPTFEKSGGVETPCLTADALQQAREEFYRMHRQSYGHADPHEPVEMTAVRLVTVGIRPKHEMANAPPSTSPGSHFYNSVEPSDIRPVYTDTGWQDVPVYRREALIAGSAFSGPALILQEDATTYVANGWHATVEPYANLILKNKK